MIHDKKRKEKIMPREKNTVGYSIQEKCLHLGCTQEKQTNLSCNFFFPFSSLLPQTGNVKKVLDTELPYHQCLRIGFYGLDLNSCPIHDFADYKFSIQSNPRIDEIQFKSNPYICGSDADLIQSISNPPFCRLVCRLKFFNYVQSTN